LGFGRGDLNYNLPVTFDGYGGNDTLDGRGGADQLVFKRGDGSDMINNFNTTQDAIQIGRGASEFDDLTITQSGSDVEVTFANVSITLDGLDVANVTSALFCSECESGGPV